MRFNSSGLSQFHPLLDGESGSGGGGNPGNSTFTGGGRTLTQAELDAMFGGVRSQAKETAIRELLSTLGAKDIDELKTFISKGKEADSKISEAEKAREEAITKANERLIRSAVLAEAATVGFIDPADAFLFADKAKLAVKDDGTIEGVKEAIEAVAKAKPHLVKAEPVGGTPRSRGKQADVSENDLISAKRNLIDYSGF